MNEAPPDADDRDADGRNTDARPAEDPADAALMERFQAGDASAYELLVRRHLEFVHRHARRFVSDSASADDIAQEVFLRLYRSADLFRDPSNFKGWLATMTHRLALNEIRTRKRKRWTARSTLAPGSAQEWRPGYDPEAPDSEVMRSERVELVRSAMLELPERQREALWLQRFEGWDLEQLSSTFEMSIPAVKSLLHRARTSLLKILEPQLKGEAGLAPSEPRSDGDRS